MAEQVAIGRAAEGKVRSFWVGFGLSIITLGIYYYVWYYLVNDEVKEIGGVADDSNLANSSPFMSVVAVLVGGILIVPPLISVYNYGVRIRRAQRLVGVAEVEQINPVTAFVLLFPGALLIIPMFIHYWYLTKHQNIALLALAGSGSDAPAALTPVA